MTENQSPPAHSQRYIDALGWAAELHRGQQRKGKDVPYIAHLIAVSALVWEDGGQLGHLAGPIKGLSHGVFRALPG